MSLIGTKQTSRADLTMSVDGAERKSAVRSQTNAIDPKRACAIAALAAQHLHPLSATTIENLILCTRRPELQ
jgi:hypothetical protein